jgi:succinyl-CoA synthetase beta subunit
VDLYEYQGKQLFARYGIATSPGAVALTADHAVEEADRIGYPVVVKAQVLVGGRGKAGGIKLAADAAAVRDHASAILGMDIKGHVVGTVWIERASEIAEEYYASFTLDRAAKLHLGMLSRRGGVDIEEVAATEPDAIARIHVDPVDGLSDEQTDDWITAAGLPDAARAGARDVLSKLYVAYTDGDCDLVEINPLILTAGGEVHALDAKVTLDTNAAFRHPEWEEYQGTQVLQRSRARDEYVRRREPGRWASGELSRHWWRRQCRGDGRRARGRQQRPGGPVDIHQHLRRNHTR